MEILALRNDTQKRVKAYKAASGEVKQLQQIMLAKNREQEEESKRARQHRIETMQAKKKGGVIDMLMEKKYLTQMMIHEQEKEIQMKQKRRMEIKRMEEEARARKEQERIEKEQKVKEFFQQKLAEEAAEAKRAEKLVRELERKEKEWIAKLRNAQVVQEDAFDQLETALHKDGVDGGTYPPSSSKTAMRRSGGSNSDSPKRSGDPGSAEQEGFRPGQTRPVDEEDEVLSGSLMSEMNMSDPVDAVETAERRQKQEASLKQRSSTGGSRGSSAGGSVGASGSKKKAVGPGAVARKAR